MSNYERTTNRLVRNTIANRLVAETLAKTNTQRFLTTKTAFLSDNGAEVVRNRSGNVIGRYPKVYFVHGLMSEIELYDRVRTQFGRNHPDLTSKPFGSFQKGELKELQEEIRLLATQDPEE